MLNSVYAGARGRRLLALFPLPSMNRLNETEPATFAFFLFWAFIRGSFSVFYHLVFQLKLLISTSNVQCSTMFPMSQCYTLIFVHVMFYVSFIVWHPYWVFRLIIPIYSYLEKKCHVNASYTKRYDNNKQMYFDAFLLFIFPYTNIYIVTEFRYFSHF